MSDQSGVTTAVTRGAQAAVANSLDPRWDRRALMLAILLQVATVFLILFDAFNRKAEHYANVLDIPNCVFEKFGCLFEELADFLTLSILALFSVSIVLCILARRSDPGSRAGPWIYLTSFAVCTTLSLPIHLWPLYLLFLIRWIVHLLQRRRQKGA